MILKMFNTEFKGDNLSRNNPTDAGADVKSAMGFNIPAYSSRLVNTGLHVEIPPGYVGILKSRSGLAVKRGIEVGAGIIDSGYVGEIKVMLRNVDRINCHIEKGDKIAQLLIMPVTLPSFKEVSSLEEFEATERGEKGFGSSGK